MFELSVHYARPRPLVAIECTGGGQIGRCYYESHYRITSTARLSYKQILDLWNARVIGCGQEFGILSQCDGHEDAAGMDTCEPVMVDSVGKKYPEIPVINKQTGRPEDPIEMPYYVYETWCRIDSSD